MESVVPRNRPLAELLARAASQELEVLADLITDGGKGRLALDGAIKTLIVRRKDEGALQTIADVLDAEIRAFGGNSLANRFRSGGVDYLELAADVARKLGGKPDNSHDAFAIEEIVIEQAVDKYSPADSSALRTGGAALSEVLARIVQNMLAASGSVLGVAATGGAAGVASAIGGRVASLAAPPLALAAAGYGIFQASGPAFRVTVPAVLQIAKIRRRQVDADFAAYTEGLRACL